MNLLCHRGKRETTANVFLLFVLAFLFFASVRQAVAAEDGGNGGNSSAPPLSSANSTGKEKPPAEPVKLVLQLLRTDTTNAADVTGTTATIGTPTLTTLDGSSATIAVTGDDFSYTMAFSPKIESNGKVVQILWSIRISGKSLPGGATGITLTGASKVAPAANAGIAEISVADPTTGRKSLFRLQGVTTIGDSAGTVNVAQP